MSIIEQDVEECSDNAQCWDFKAVCQIPQLYIIPFLRNLMHLCIHDLKIYGYFEKVVGKVHATIPKGIVGGFEFTALQISLKE